MTKFGSGMYKMCLGASKHLMTKNKKPNVLYYILNFTWGLIPTLLASIVWLVLFVVKGFKSEKFCGRRYIAIGKRWGGLSLGINFVCSENEGYLTKCHELGHTYQNAILGVFVIFLGWIPSVIRYWTSAGGTKKPAGWYSSFWYEGCADAIGKYAYDVVK